MVFNFLGFNATEPVEVSEGGEISAFLTGNNGIEDLMLLKECKKPAFDGDLYIKFSAHNFFKRLKEH